MLNNVKLGTKIGLQLALLILIMLIMGVISAIRMKNVSDQSILMGTEYIPEVRISAELERAVFLTMYTMRGYGLTGEKSYYDEATGHMETVKSLIQEAKRLTEKSGHLDNFKASIGDMEKEMSTYEDMMTKTRNENAEIGESRRMLDEAAIKFMSVCRNLLRQQTETHKTEIAAGLENEVLHQRLRKITGVNNAIDLLNETRVATFKAQALLDPEYIRNARENFDRITEELQNVAAITYLNENKERIRETQAAADAYRDAMNTALKNLVALKELTLTRKNVGSSVLEAAKKITTGGMDQAISISDKTVSSLSNALKIIIFGLIICIIAGIGLAIIITRGITRPIRQAVELANAISQGDMSRKLDIRSQNEIGELAAALNRSTEDLSGMLLQIRQNSEKLSGSSEDLSTVASQLASGSEETSAELNAMASGIEEMSVNTQGVSSTSEQMTAIMNSIASAIEEMTMSIGEIANNAKEGSEISQQAMGMAEKASKTINILGDAAGEIGEVTEIIRQIAQQTNLLALNATIEAASAGDAGKGFAVVANEIKQLAKKSATSAEDIAKRIKGVQVSAQETIEAMDGVSEIIGKINVSSGMITQSVEQQRLTSNEISSSIQQADGGVSNIAASIAEIAKGANDMSENAGTAAQGVNEISASAHQVRSSASDLSQMARLLQEVVGRFRIGV